MKESQVSIFLKPDALSGPYAVAHATLVSDFFCCMSAAFDGRAFYEGELRSTSSQLAAERAFLQITERAVSEEAFRLPLQQKHLCRERLLRQAEYYKNAHEFSTTREVILQALQAFGFSVVSEKYHTLSSQDIEIIYDEPIRENPALRPRLLEYLGDKVVCLLLLGGQQEISALQIIKTYIRYFIRYREGQQHRLENLMHVPDGQDLPYLLRLCLQ